jgi:hypothetical protein
MKTLPYACKIDDLSRQGTCIEFFSACQDRHLHVMMQLCTMEGQVDFMPLGEQGKGSLMEVGRRVWLRLMESFPDLDYSIRDFSVNSNGSITCQVRMRGTQRKEFANIPSKGLSVNSDQIFIFRFDQQDKITRIFIHWDHEKFKNQLGDTAH